MVKQEFHFNKYFMHTFRGLFSCHKETFLPFYHFPKQNIDGDLLGFRHLLL